MEEIDQNWDKLIAGTVLPKDSNNHLISPQTDISNLSIPEEENLDPTGLQPGAQSPNKVTKAFNSQGIFGGVDMFHQLHCLNSLRKAVVNGRMEQFAGAQENMMRIHLYHCIGQLRQAIMCYGDLTPVTLTLVYNYERGVLNLVGQTEYEHTCRDFGGLQKELQSRRFVDTLREKFIGYEGSGHLVACTSTSCLLHLSLALNSAPRIPSSLHSTYQLHVFPTGASQPIVEPRSIITSPNKTYPQLLILNLHQ